MGQEVDIKANSLNSLNIYYGQYDKLWKSNTQKELAGGDRKQPKWASLLLDLMFQVISFLIVPTCKGEAGVEQYAYHRQPGLGSDGNNECSTRSEVRTS